ncbi:hypothetical protein MASR2M15_05610 [Anaerolineales bacterium]
MLKHLTILILSSCLLLSLSACREQSTDTADLDIQLALQPDPAILGESTLFITVYDKNQQPVTDATVSARGDMSHAGMQPVTATTAKNQQGLYELPFEWTMAGDWFVEIQVNLPDGRSSSKTFPFTVALEANESS